MSTTNVKGQTKTDQGTYSGTASTPSYSDGQTQQASKRPAPTSDATEAADYKTKVKKPNPVQTKGPPDGVYSKPMDGFLASIANRYSSPFPVVPRTFIVVDTSLCGGWFRTIRLSLLNCLYPDDRYHSMGVISESAFILVCRYFMKARIDHVYASVTGGRPAIARDVELPKCLADVINGIGHMIVGGGAISIVPEPEASPQDTATSLTSVVTYATLSAFERLVQAAKVRGFIRTSTLSTTSEGTAWWALSAVNAVTNSVATSDDDEVVVKGAFKEWTPSDAIIAAIVRRGNSVSLGTRHDAEWSFDTITCLSGIINAFNLDA